MNIPEKYLASKPCFMQYFIPCRVVDFILKQCMGGKQGCKIQTLEVSIIFKGLSVSTLFLKHFCCLPFETSSGGGGELSPSKALL